VRAAEVQAGTRGRSWLRPATRFIKWWAGCFLLLGPLAVCPICGQPGCAGGALSAGVLGAIVAALTFVPRRIARLYGRLARGKRQAS
jgi:hypothetical protein